MPACKVCNSSILSHLEKCIIQIFNDVDLRQSILTRQQREYIIRWLEVIDYKFQVINVRKKFQSGRGQAFVPYLADLPLSIMRTQFSPSQIITQLRRSLHRITRKDKSSNLNSLVFGNTKNPSFNFAHNMDEFVFIEMPTFNKFFFYFYNKKFLNTASAIRAADEVLKTRIYNTR